MAVKSVLLVPAFVYSTWQGTLLPSTVYFTSTVRSSLPFLQRYFADSPKNTPRGYEVEITIPVSGVQKLWEEIKDKIPEKQIAQPLTLKRWNKWDFRVADPFGFYVRFTELVDWGQ